MWNIYILFFLECKLAVDRVQMIDMGLAEEA